MGRTAAGRIGGGLGYRPILGVFALTPSPQGGWTSPQHSKAIYYNGNTYFAWVDGADGDLMIGKYNHASQAVETSLVATASPINNHQNPAILIRESDKRIIVAVNIHGGPNIFIRISTNPEDIGAFGAAVGLDASIGASDYAFPTLLQLTGVPNDPIYLFYRDDSGGVGRLAYSKSIDDGATWSARTLVLRPFSNLIGWVIRATATRVDVLMNDRDPHGSEGPNDLGHMFMDPTDDKWYTSAGAEITAAKPFTHGELTQIETNVVGVLPIDGVAGPNPIFTYTIDNGDSTVTAWYARWDGSTWDRGEIAVSGHLELDRYFGLAAINSANVEEVFVGVRTGVGTSELYSFTSSDLGSTWDDGTALTSGSTEYNVGPVAPVNGDGTLPVIWLRGTFNDQSDFAFSIMGLRR